MQSFHHHWLPYYPLSTLHRNTNGSQWWEDSGLTYFKNNNQLWLYLALTVKECSWHHSRFTLITTAVIKELSLGGQRAHHNAPFMLMMSLFLFREKLTTILLVNRLELKYIMCLYGCLSRCVQKRERLEMVVSHSSKGSKYLLKYRNIYFSWHMIELKWIAWNGKIEERERCVWKRLCKINYISVYELMKK